MFRLRCASLNKTVALCGFDKGLCNLFSDKGCFRSLHHFRNDWINFQPAKGFTVAQLGPPSLPVPGTWVSRISLGALSTRLSISAVMPVSGTLRRLLQLESI